MTSCPRWRNGCWTTPGVVMATPQLYFPDGHIQNLPRRKPTPWALLARQLAPRFGGVMQKS